MMKTEFLTPVGRLVQGDPFEPQTKNMQGQPLLTQDGTPTQRYLIVVAFPKSDQSFSAFMQQLSQVAHASFPALGNIAMPWDPACFFSWKVQDGDGLDGDRKPNSGKEGFAGHWIVKFGSSFAPKCYHTGHYQPHEVIKDKNLIRRGYYVRVAGTIEGNGQQKKPGLYVNLGMIELAGQGPEIISGPDATTIFGGAPAVLPPGASPLPMHAAGGMPGAAPLAMPGAGVAMPGYQQVTPPVHAAIAPVGVPQMPGAVPMGGTPVMPNPGFAAGVPQMPGMPAPPLAAPVPQMTAKAQGYTREALIAQGWTDETLRSNGLMI